MPLTPGSRIGSYTVTGLIGAGGMGEVYRATDTGLGRDVAIKVLPASVAADADRLARFRREAQLLAALNHPNIAAIHGLEEADGTPFLVLELVEGEDLAQRLARGPIPPDEAIEIARLIAEALEEAHDKGIVHRDLKPANVKLSPDGKVKVLDFGLAKAFTSSTASGDAPELSQSPTLIQSGTQAGVILGTAAYMSPEQARGKPVDRRTDIWAFGAVVWEMLIGRPLFGGETVSDIVAAVLTREPDWAALPADTPDHLRRVLRRCLVRDARQRLQAIGDARIELGGGPADIVEASPATGGTATSPVSAGRRWGLTIAVALVAAAIAVAATIVLRSKSSAVQETAASAEPISFTIDPPPGHRLIGGMALSPDGRSLALVARNPDGQTALWIREFDKVQPHLIAGTEGAIYPFWSPDGRRLGFFAGNSLRSVSLVGEAVTPFARTASFDEVRGAAWGPDDTIVYARTYTGPLFKVAASGGESAPATQLDPVRKDGTHRWPIFLPDGRHFVYYAARGSGVEPGELRVGSLDSDIARTLTTSHSMAIFMPPDFLLFVRGKSLIAQQIDLDRLEMSGDPVLIGINLPGSMNASGSRYLSAWRARTLAYRQEFSSNTSLIWVDRTGRELSVACDDNAWHVYPRLSPDGDRISVSHYEYGQESGDIHVHHAGRQLDLRVTFDTMDDQQAVWNPDGSKLAVSTISPTEPSTTYIIDPSRPGERIERWRSDTSTWVEDWFPDGSLLLSVNIVGEFSNIYRLPADDGAKLIPVVVSPFSNYTAELSSDSRWLTYVNNSTGQPEVYVRAIESGEEWRVSMAGGIAPTWRGDDRELFYVDARGHMIAVPTSLDPTFTMGEPEVLFDGALDYTSGRQYDVTPDGQRFIINRPINSEEQSIIVTVDLPDDFLIGGGR